MRKERKWNLWFHRQQFSIELTVANVGFFIVSNDVSKIILQQTNFDIEPNIIERKLWCAPYEETRMKNNNQYVNEEKIRHQLSEQFRLHRKKLDYTQAKVAELLGKSESVYQRWESTGEHLGNIFDILEVFRVLDFSTADIIDVLGLPPLDVSEIEAVCQDKKICKDIKKDGIYFYMKKNCEDITDLTFEKLLDMLFLEHLKRQQKLIPQPYGESSINSPQIDDNMCYRLYRIKV